MLKLLSNCYLFILILCLTCSSAAATDIALRLSLNGFLGKEALVTARETVKTFEEQAPGQTLVIEINSTSADLLGVLELAKDIYTLKNLKALKVIVYLNDNVVGPAAILPFLAQDLYSSLSMTWGNISFGSPDVLPPNILRNRIRSLIDERHPQATLLYTLADAMSDSSLQRVEENQRWTSVENDPDAYLRGISSPGQTLVVNQNQLRSLKLVKAILPLQEFNTLYPSKETLTDSNAIDSTIENKLQKAIHFNAEAPNTIGYLYVGNHEGMISQSTWLYIKKGLEYYKEKRPSFIILELDTPGGEVFAAQKISDALKDLDIKEGIPVVAFINNWAISAGAMLVYSSRFIAVVKDASMGAAEPVYMGEAGKLESASEKVNSALRTDFANRARFFDRNPLIAEAMVDKDIILVWRHGKVVKLDQESQIRTTGIDPDVVISGKGKLLTLSADQLMEYGVADLLLMPAKLPEITEQEQAQGQWPANKALLFQNPFFAKIPQATIDAYRMDWKTQFFVFLTTPFISSLLFMALIIGIYLEISQPGLSLPGMVAATSLFLIILSSFALEIGNWLELILLLTGLALLLLELFVLPSFGFVGILGIILFIVGLFGMLLPGLHSIDFEYDTKTFNAAGQYLLERLAWLGATLIMSFLMIAILARFIVPKFSGFKRFVLTGHEQDASKGFFAGEDPDTLPQPGTVGEVLAALRPAGKIIVNDHIYEAISTGDFIEAHEPIQVVRLEGSVIVVNRIQVEKV